jgi:colicin import membrane protein
MTKQNKNNMKKLIFAMMMCLPMGLSAQNTWEMPEEKEQAANPDQKYLAGAVPEVDGKVVFHTVIDAPGKSAEQVQNIVRQYMQKMVTEKNQFEQSRIVLDDSVKHQVVGYYQEWLVFKSTALVLDRTRLMYNLIVTCEDGKADIMMNRIHYLYDEEREPQSYSAEEWITDKEGLNKKQNKLARVSGKFRRKTIDRKDYLFNKFAELLKRANTTIYALSRREEVYEDYVSG